MNKFLLISLITSSVLNGQYFKFLNPLQSSFKSVDNGGTKEAIEAYQDGVGVVISGELSDSADYNMKYKELVVVGTLL